MKNINLQTLITRNYFKSSLIPILVIEVTLLLMYFGINSYISERNRATLLDEATKNIKEITSREVTSINKQLLEVTYLSLIMQRDHEAFFAYSDACFLPNGKPQFKVHENGAFFKTADIGGASLYYANTTQMGEKQQRKALCSEMLDPLLKSIVETSSIITQAYFNTWDDMNRLYPFMPDASIQYGPAINMEDYNFYYDADSLHNPERKPVWTGAYLDPAGQGWMVSLIVPIYSKDFLEGVSGLDVTIGTFVQNILDLKFPWDASTFMVDKTGTILAMQSKVEKIFKLKELGSHDYSENIKETIEKPKEFNLLNNSNESLKSKFSQLFTSKARISSVDIDGVDYLISQEIVGETGWRMMTLVEKEKVFAPITKLKSLSDKIGLAAVLLMVLFYIVFFMFLIATSKKLTGIIATPIIKLSDITKDLGKHFTSEQLKLSGITEVDTLTENFNTMSKELNTAISLAMTARQEADSAISNFLDSLLVVDDQLRITRVNRESCHLLGFDEDELLNQPVHILFDEPEIEVASYFNFPFRSDTQDKEELRNIELTFVSKDGSKLSVFVNLARVTNNTGGTVGVVAGAKDISVLKQTIRQAEQQKQFNQNIVDTIPGGLLVLDYAFQLKQSNDTYSRLLQHWSDKYGFIEEKLAATILTELAQKLPKQQGGEIHISGTCDEIIIEFHSSSSCKKKQGDSQVIYLHDVTLRHKAQVVRNLQATVLAQTPDSVIVTTPDGVIFYVNPATEKSSGYTQNELLGKEAAVLKSDHTDPVAYQALWKTITKGNVWSGRITSTKKDKTTMQEDVTVSPVRNEVGDITNFVAIKRDVTEIDSLQRQLLQAKKMEAIGQLAAGIAHEINTPMQYVQNNVTFLERAFADFAVLIGDYKKLQKEQNPKLSKEATEHLEDIDLDFLLEEVEESIGDTHGGINRVVKIVSAMKDFSHPGTDQKVGLDLNRAIESTITVCRNEWKHVAEVNTNFDSGLPMVYCLPDQLNQAVLNLIINSAHAIEETGTTASGHLGRISVSTHYDEKWVEIRISDTGGGIPEEIRERVFDPFYTTKVVGKGTGQGLSIVHDVVVQKHGGTIDFISAPNEGTTFILRLPIEAIVKDEEKV